jgi:hypothetical protein
VGPGLELLDQLVASGDFNTATKLCTVLQKASANSTAEREIVQKRIKEFGTLRTAHDEFLIHKAKLEQWPDDPAANFAVGSYYCFVENRWNIGMTLLLKGNNAAVKAAVATEQSRPQSADQLMALGDAWWDAGEKENAASIYRSGMWRHASSIYQAALDRGGINGLRRTRLEQRINLAAATGSPWAATKPRRVLLWRGTAGLEDAEEAAFKSVANGAVVTPDRATARDVMADPATYSKYSVIVFGPSQWRAIPANTFSDTVRRSIQDFVRKGGDLVLFEQLKGSNMSIVTDLFGVKTIGWKRGALVADPELKDKVLEAGFDDQMLKRVHFFNTYENLPEGSRVLLSCTDTNHTAGAVIVPVEKGRVILIGTSWDKSEANLNRTIVELAFQAGTSKRLR